VDLGQGLEAGAPAAQGVVQLGESRNESRAGVPGVVTIGCLQLHLDEGFLLNLPPIDFDRLGLPLSLSAPRPIRATELSPPMA
jgi:hypothetical protein